MEKEQPNTDFDHYLLKRMCLNDAEDVKMKYAPEYWEDRQEEVLLQSYRVLQNVS